MDHWELFPDASAAAALPTKPSLTSAACAFCHRLLLFPSLLHGADLVAPGPIVNSLGGGILAGASIVDIGGRKMLSQRSLRGIDGDGTNVVINSTANVYSNVGKNVCPTTNTAWAAWESYSNSTEYTMYGDLVHDAAICNTAAAGVGKVVTTANATGVVSPRCNR